MLSELPPMYYSVGRNPTSDEIDGAYQLAASTPFVDERKLQLMKPASPLSYAEHSQYFWQTFLDKNPLEKQMTHWDGITIVGRREWHDFLMEEIRPDREQIEEVAKKKVTDILIIMGSGVEMNTLYRAIGGGFDKKGGSYPRAIAGGNSCFYNMDEYEKLQCFDTSAQVHSRRHEFRHVAVDAVLDDITSYTNTSRIDRIVHEALGGPSEMAWRSVLAPDVPVDFSQLHSHNLFQWIADEERRLKCESDFFESPVVKKFYLDYVYKQGGFEDWFKYAVELGKKAKK